MCLWTPLQNLVIPAIRQPMGGEPSGLYESKEGELWSLHHRIYIPSTFLSDNHTSTTSLSDNHNPLRIELCSPQQWVAPCMDQQCI